jgi:histone-lysine N-methyltransferase SETMAR
VYDSFSEVYGPLIPEYHTIRKWRLMFFGKGSLFPEHHVAGRPRASGISEVIEEELQKQPNASTRALAAKTGLDRSTVKHCLIYDLNMEKMSTLFVPHSLTESQKLQRVGGARELLDVLILNQEDGFSSFITGDETYLLYNYPVRSRWMPRGSGRPTAPKSAQGAPKRLLTAFFSGKKIWTYHFSEAKEMMCTSIFVDDVLAELDAKMCEAEEVVKEPVVVHFDNASSHRSKKAQAAMKRLKFATVTHPPYSPDLASADFYLFGHMKRYLHGLDIGTDAKLVAAVTTFLSNLSEANLEPVFQEWMFRCQWVISHGGAYYRRE